MRIITAILFLASATATYGQYGWSQTIDTVSTGNFDDFNPQVDHGGMVWTGLAPSTITKEWVVFERRSQGTSSIIGIRYLMDQLKWDPTVYTISPSMAGVTQEFPDVCTDQKLTSLAAWQEKTGGIWNIYYSTCQTDSGNWSVPIALTNDTISNTNVKVRALSDSSLVLIWRRDTCILYSVFNSKQFSTPGMLATSNFDSTEYDFTNASQPNPSSLSNRFVWTQVGESGNKYCLVSSVKDFISFSLSPPDTISSNGDMDNPEFMTNPYSSLDFPTFTFNLKNNQHYEAWQASMQPVADTSVWTSGEIAGETDASDLNAVVYTPKELTGIETSKRMIPQIFPDEYYAWERQTSTDTSIVFSNASDSLESGSNPSISTLPTGIGSGAGFVVWESNRTGRYHIYSRNYIWHSDGINEPNAPASNFELSQNFPNPFNPTTVISYRLPIYGFVTLKVYDVLGREVQTLVNERQNIGNHSVTFKAFNLASGVYFYRLQAGSYSQTRKLVLLK